MQRDHQTGSVDRKGPKYPRPTANRAATHHGTQDYHCCCPKISDAWDCATERRETWGELKPTDREDQGRESKKEEKKESDGEKETEKNSRTSCASHGVRAVSHSNP